MNKNRMAADSADKSIKIEYYDRKDALLKTGIRILPKPYKSNELGEAIRATLID